MRSLHEYVLSVDADFKSILAMKISQSKPMLLLMGCTAGGKSNLAFELAQRLDGEILSVDSMKIYRRMDIGTAKPSMVRREA